MNATSSQTQKRFKNKSVNALALFISLSYFSSSLYACTEWRYVSSGNSGEHLYIDLSSIKTKRHEALTWVKYIGAKKSEEDSPKSIKSYISFDCKEFSIKSLSMFVYEMDEKTIVASEKTPDATYKPVRENSNEELLWLAACKEGLSRKTQR